MISLPALDWSRRDVRQLLPKPDPILAGVALALAGLGLVMVASASISISAHATGRPFGEFERQAIFAILGLIVASCVYALPLKIWMRLRYPALLVALLLLLIVLVPGIGKNLNGSARWISLGPLSLQASEPARLLLLIYVAAYATRYRKELTSSFKSFLRPILMIALAGLLLLAEPDFGGTLVLFATTLATLFYAGARKRDVALLFVVVGLAATVLAVTSPYRLARLTTFLNPWADPYTSGFQLTQALIAVGRGGVFGVGLGESVQKLFYLPEAQSDFLFSVLSEELGLVGVLAVIGLYLTFTLRAFVIARRALLNRQQFAAYLTFALGLLIGVQAFVNIGVNFGVLPTKGLTLPLMSAGGSSLVVDMVAVALVLRAAYETRVSREDK